MAVAFERKCVACGAPFSGGQYCEKCGVDQQAWSFEQDKANLLYSGAIRSARSSLLWVGILMALGTIGAFALSGGEAVPVLVGGLVLAGLYGGLWHWSKLHPLGATAAGLGVFVTLIAGAAVANPATLFNGILYKIIVFVLLVRGVRAGVVLRGHGVSGL